MDRYAAGILYPLDAGRVEPSQTPDVEDSSGEDDPDPPVELANMRYPSSMGLTFSVDTAAAETIRATISAARYLDDEDGPNEAGDTVYHRTPTAPQPVDLHASDAGQGKVAVTDDGLELYWRIRAADSENSAAVTLVLLNSRTTPRGHDRDTDCFFQAGITVTAPQATSQPFVDRRSVTYAKDPDLATYALLYSEARSLAVGHGCSVTWKVDGEPGRSFVATTPIPTFELPVSHSNPELPATGMVALADAVEDEYFEQLNSLTSGYAGWVKGLGAEIDDLPSDLRKTAQDHVALCTRAAARMTEGVAALREDPDVRRAFVLMNRVMAEQRARSILVRNDGVGEIDVAAATWRPFQLAFILLCTRGIADAAAPDRAIADLLWFPTGGGKTEAYLGLIAFTIFLRRIRAKKVGASGAGVTAIMRYTLRLLTAQQFQRAAILIAACELQRRRCPDLGDGPISIGLWIGRQGTPNTLDEARRGVKRLRDGLEPQEGNPMQLRSCPSCGTPLTPKDYYVAETDPRLVTRCPNAQCDFAVGGLPVWVVDEDIYRFRPSLLISTADKFAALPWREQAAELFNIDHATEGPPELIIQDELHLISGPLGTLVGLYETALDSLASWGGTRPKVIASTATIRRAGDQSRGLFERDVLQFPPPGLSAKDSYFAVEAQKHERADRCYVGVMASSISHSTLMIRTYASLLQSIEVLPGKPEDKDPYWTLVGYFNSLRVLSGARLQVQDDVDERIKYLAADGRRRVFDNQAELTSREASAAIPERLKEMALCYPDPNALDVILATNMISVGMDIDRLGLMVVMGQPQATSEYIQATSRVGREYPGLIVVLFNSGRSRDRSHYEAFPTYHGALYRQVESTSVTPFSPRARDRALHAVLIAMARHSIPALRPNEGARLVGQFEPEIEAIIDSVVGRVTRVDAREEESTRRQLDDTYSRWKERAEEEPDLVYWSTKEPEKSLLIEASDDEFTDYAFPTLWSLRDVDKTSGLYLVRSLKGGTRG
jgi:Distinct helicase family with a unique C-terminal domain including a metal-binding cysteine cluster